MAGLADTAKRAKGAGYTDEEQDLLKTQGVMPRGIWFSKDGKGIKKDDVDAALANAKSSSPSNAIVIKKLDLIDGKLDKIASTLLGLKKSFDEQYQLKRRDRDEKEIEDKEATLDRKKDAEKTVTPKFNADNPLNIFSILLLPALKMLNEFLDKFKGAKTAVLATFATILSKSGMIYDSIIKAIKVTAADAGKLVTKIAEGMKSALEGIKNTIGKMSNWIKEKLGFKEEVPEAGKAPKVEGSKAKVGEGGKPTLDEDTKEVEKLAKGTRTGGDAVKLSARQKGLLKFLMPLRSWVATIAKYAKFLVFIDTVIAICRAAFFGGSWDEVKKSFIRAIGALIGAELGFTAGAALGALIGSVIPGLGTLIGAIAGAAGGVIASFYGASAGEWLADEIWQVCAEGKDPKQVAKDFEKITIDAAKSAAASVVSAGKSAALAVENAASSAASSIENYFTGKSTTPTSAAPTSKPTALDNKQVKIGKAEKGTADQAIAYLVSKGWSKEQAAGIVGNLVIESQLKTDAVGDSGHAYGIAQWHEDRQAIFQKQYGKDIHDASFMEQLAFVDWELKNNEKRAGDLIKKTQTASEAAQVDDQKYERSDHKAQAQRMQVASRLAGDSIVPPTQVASARQAPAAPIIVNTQQARQSTHEQQHGIPSPGYPTPQEDIYAVYFNAHEPAFGATGLTT